MPVRRAWTTPTRSAFGSGGVSQTGSPHESPALSVSVAGRTKIVTLTPEEVPAVAVAVKRYRTAVNALETEARAELDGLLVRVAARRAGGKR